MKRAEKIFEESIILTEIYRELALAVEKLPEECRKVFHLCYFQGLDNEKPHKN